eukprot:4489016-Prymnesium_polylepis.1
MANQGAAVFVQFAACTTAGDGAGDIAGCGALLQRCNGGSAVRASSWPSFPRHGGRCRRAAGRR